jgi:hypothetical protein
VLVHDKLQSLYQGRTSCLQNSGTNLPLFILDEYEELEMFNALTYSDQSNASVSVSYSISNFTQTCSLSVILERIFTSLYTERSGSRDTEHLLRECNSLHEQIKTWRSSLPSQLEFLLSNPDTCVPMPHTLALLYGPPFIFICHLLRALE